MITADEILPHVDALKALVEINGKRIASLTSAGMRYSIAEVLAHLSEAPDGRLRMSDLASFAVLTPSGLTRLVDKLVRDGLVERLRCESDARVVYASVTQQGRDRLACAYPTHLRGVRQHLVDRLDADQLEAIAAALGPLTADCPTHPASSHLSGR